MRKGRAGSRGYLALVRVGMDDPGERGGRVVTVQRGLAMEEHSSAIVPKEEKAGAPGPPQFGRSII
jgi:hypothetical protein